MTPVPWPNFTFEGLLLFTSQNSALGRISRIVLYYYYEMPTQLVQILRRI